MSRSFCAILFWCFVIQKGLAVGKSPPLTNLSGVPSYKCTEFIGPLIEYTYTCVLNDVSLTRLSKNFKIIPHRNVSDISKFHISTDSKMEILTNDVCVQLPYIREFTAQFNGIKSIEENAFEKCFRMEELNLYGNKLETLPLGILDGNKELKTIAISSNKLTQIDMNLFKNHPMMENIILPGNKIMTVLSVSEMPVMKNLKIIYLQENQLTDLDVEGILEKSPNLETFYLHGNKFDCQRKLQIEELLKAKKIKFEDLELCVEKQITPSLRRTTTQIIKITNKPTTTRITRRTTTLSSLQHIFKFEEEQVDDDDDEGDLSVAINPFSTNDCGDITHASKFVHGGEVRSEESFPWIAAMLIKNQYQCTANFISRTRAVTAAHCFEKELRPKDIKLEILAFPVILVEDFKKHPRFRDIPKYDIAILNTEEVQEEKFVPVCLPNKFVSLFGFQGDVLSWAPAPESDEEALLSAKLTVTRRSYCESVTFNVPSHSLCVVHGHEGSRLCKGDSGAGFIILAQNQGVKKRDRRHFLHGIVSTGKVKDRNCSINEHVILTDVTKFLSFVTSP